MNKILLSTLLSFSLASSGWAKDWILVPVKGKAVKSKGNMAALGLTPAKSIAALGAHLVKGAAAPVAPLGYTVQETVPVRVLDLAPNDPKYISQWNLELVKAPSAWSAAKNGGLQMQAMAGILAAAVPQMVAVIDTGIDDSHPDLNGKVYDGANYVDGGDYVDDHGHGTFVGSLIGAITNNGIGMAGMNPTVQLLAVKVLDANGYGNDFAVAQGIVWAVDMGASVINLSLGTSYDSQVMHDAVDYAIAHNALVVAASGNTGHEDHIYPAAWTGVVSVGASTSDDRPAPYSTYNGNLSLVAPGGDADGNAAHDILGAAPGGIYTHGSGTSFAAPQVAAAAALYLGVHPQAGAARTFAALTATVDPISLAPGHDSRIGWGRLNTARLLGVDTAPSIFAPSTLPVDGLSPEAGTLAVSVGAGEPDVSPLNPDPSHVAQVWAFLLDSDGNEVSRQLLQPAAPRDYRGQMAVPAWNGLADRTLTLSFQAIDSSGHTTPDYAGGAVMQIARKGGSSGGTEVAAKMTPLANPSSMVSVRVMAARADTFKLKVYDLTGKLVAELTAPVQAGENRLQVSEVLASGIYLAYGEQTGQNQRNMVKLAIKR